MKFLII